MTGDELLPADPTRGVTPAAIAAEAAEFDGIDYRFGMGSAVGAARLDAALAAVRAVLAAGCGREVALATLRGEFLRLERDGLREYSDTVVRETIVGELADACSDAGLAEFTDDEVNEVALHLAVRGMAGSVDGWRQGYAAARTTAAADDGEHLGQDR